MSPLKPNNPAARLHNILLVLRAANPQDTIANAWRGAFNTSGLPLQDLVSKMALVYSLPTGINNDLRRLDIYDPEMMFWWRELAQTAQYALTQEWGLAKAHITGDVIAAIRSRSRLLNKYSPEPILDDGVIEQTKASVQSIIEAVKSADGLDDDLKQRILQQADFISDLLDNVEILGGVSIKHDIDEALADIVQQTEQVKESDNTIRETIKARVTEVVIWLSAFNVGGDAYNHAQSVLQALMPPKEVHQLTDGKEVPQLPEPPKALPPSKPSDEEKPEPS